MGWVGLRKRSWISQLNLWKLKRFLLKLTPYVIYRYHILENKSQMSSLPNLVSLNYKGILKYLSPVLLKLAIAIRFLCSASKLFWTPECLKLIAAQAPSADIRTTKLMLSVAQDLAIRKDKEQISKDVYWSMTATVKSWIWHVFFS